MTETKGTSPMSGTGSGTGTGTGIGAGAGAGARLTVPVWMAVAGMAAAFGAGYVANEVGAAAPSPASTGQGHVVEQGQAGGMSAPPLTEEQLKGSLPPNHPGFATTPATGATTR